MESLMTMKTLYVFLILIVILGVLDFIWLGVVAKKFYVREFEDMLKNPFNIYSAIVVYLLLALGIFIFVLNNNFVKTPLSALVVGAVFGVIVYGVYDLTNYATIQNYSLKVVFVDMLWGGCIAGVSAFLTKYFAGMI